MLSHESPSDLTNEPILEEDLKQNNKETTEITPEKSPFEEHNEKMYEDFLKSIETVLINTKLGFEALHTLAENAPNDIPAGAFTLILNALMERDTNKETYHQNKENLTIPEKYREFLKNTLLLSRTLFMLKENFNVKLDSYVTDDYLKIYSNPKLISKLGNMLIGYYEKELYEFKYNEEKIPAFSEYWDQENTRIEIFGYKKAALNKINTLYKENLGDLYLTTITKNPGLRRETKSTIADFSSFREDQIESVFLPFLKELLGNIAKISTMQKSPDMDVFEPIKEVLRAVYFIQELPKKDFPEDFNISIPLQKATDRAEEIIKNTLYLVEGKWNDLQRGQLRDLDRLLEY